MRKTFDEQYLLDHRGCLSETQVRNATYFSDSCTIDQFVESPSITLKDKFWFILRKCDLTDLQKQQLAVNCGQVALAAYTAQHPDNTMVGPAITTAQGYLAGTIGADQLRQARDSIRMIVDMSNGSAIVNIIGCLLRNSDNSIGIAINSAIDADKGASAGQLLSTLSVFCATAN